jgi:hypothetical protein
MEAAEGIEAKVQAASGYYLHCWYFDRSDIHGDTDTQDFAAIDVESVGLDGAVPNRFSCKDHRSRSTELYAELTQ